MREDNIRRVKQQPRNRFKVMPPSNEKQKHNALTIFNVGKDLLLIAITVLLFLGSIISVYTSIQSSINDNSLQTSLNTKTLEKQRSTLEEFRKTYFELTASITRINAKLEFIHLQVEINTRAIERNAQDIRELQLQARK